MEQIGLLLKIFVVLCSSVIGAVIGMFVGMIVVPLKILDGSIFKSTKISSTLSTDPIDKDQI